MPPLTNSGRARHSDTVNWESGRDDRATIVREDDAMPQAGPSNAIGATATLPVRLNVKAFAVASGLFWGMGLFLLTWWIMAFDGSTHQANLISQIYRGYNLSPVGSLIGLAWATPDGLIGGAIFAWLYNVVADYTS
jgi:hypothetical protein